MDQLVSTANVPRKFLKDAFLVSHVPLKALASDPRVSYALYIPADRYDSISNDTKLPLLVFVHGTERKCTALYDEQLVSFADETPCAILAPLFPAGLDGANDLDSYKIIKSQSLRSDLAVLSILDEVAHRWPGIQTSKVFMMGFSGGGQFVHRFLYLYPERLAGVSIGAPGRVTLLDETQKWPIGIADVEAMFNRSVNTNNVRQVPIQLVVGGADNQIHGGGEFWTWLQHLRGMMQGQQEPLTLDAMGKGRLETLRHLQDTWERDGIESQLCIVDGISHEEHRARTDMLSFLKPLIQAECQERV